MAAKIEIKELDMDALRRNITEDFVSATLLKGSPNLKGKATKKSS